MFEQGRSRSFRSFDEYGNPLPRPRMLLIDSAQLESGESLDRRFREAAVDEAETEFARIVDGALAGATT